MVWNDFRNDVNGQRNDIYAQRIDENGELGNPTGVENKETKMPVESSLSQNYPNPFNPSTTIAFSIPYEELVSLKLYSPLGEEVEQLVNEIRPAGSYSVSFSASKLASGVYYYEIVAGSFVHAKKMILLK